MSKQVRKFQVSINTLLRSVARFLLCTGALIHCPLDRPRSVHRKQT